MTGLRQRLFGDLEEGRDGLSFFSAEARADAVRHSGLVHGDEVVVRGVELQQRVQRVRLLGEGTELALALQVLGQLLGRGIGGFLPER